MKKVYIYGGVVLVALVIVGYLFLGSGKKTEVVATGQVQRG
jgi:hypothetical protein